MSRRLPLAGLGAGGVAKNQLRQTRFYAKMTEFGLVGRS